MKKQNFFPFVTNFVLLVPLPYPLNTWFQSSGKKATLKGPWTEEGQFIRVVEALRQNSRGCYFK
jgi:hypothetical protein